MSVSRIVNAIKSRQPILWIQTAEEIRVLESLRTAAATLNAALSLWSITRGFRHLSPNSPLKGGDIRDPGKAIDYAVATEARAIFVLADYNHYLNDSTIQRKIREAAQDLRMTRETDKRRTIVFIGPTVKIPDGLDKDIQVIEWDLPDVAEITGIVASIKYPEECTPPQDPAQIVSACLGLTRNEIESSLSRSLVEHKTLSLQAMLGMKKEIIRKSGILEFYDAQETMGDVGGLDNLKGWLSKRKRAFTAEAAAYGLPQPKGILLTGVPGVGKSLVAKAIGAAWGMPLLRLDVGKIFGGLVGASEENMRKAIRAAEAIQPCILWLDEIEKGFSGVGGGGHSDGGTSSRVFGSFLTWMQEKKSEVFVIATANDISGLPPELLRKGRFDEIFFVDLPNQDQRAEVLQIHLAKRGKAAGDLGDIIPACADFSGAELEQVVIAAMFDAFDAGEEVSGAHLLRAATEITPLAVTMADRIGALREWAKTRARMA